MFFCGNNQAQIISALLLFSCNLSEGLAMVRISIPTLPPRPQVPPSALTLLPTRLAAAHLASFLEAGRGQTLLITGAGVSVDSGIRAYRGKEGHYSNPNYKWARLFASDMEVVWHVLISRPILYHELVEDTPRGEMFRFVPARSC